MAPRRGGGGSYYGSSSSSNSCELCNDPYTLFPDDFDTTTTRAYLAFRIIAVIVILISMIIVMSRPWLNINGSKDRAKFNLYIGSALSALIYSLIMVVDMILKQIVVEVKYSYIIIYLVEDFFIRLQDILMVAVILVCLQGARSAMVGKPSNLRIFSYLAIFVLTILTLVRWILYTKETAEFLDGNDSDSYLAIRPLDMSYASIDFAVAIAMVILALFLALKRAIPPQSWGLLLGTALAYWLSALLNVIFFAIGYYDFQGFTDSLNWASNFIGVITLMATFVLLALLSRLSNTKTREMLTKGGSNTAGMTTGVSNVNVYNDVQGFHTDTSYNNNYANGNNWQQPQPHNGINGYRQSNSQDPAAQPLYPSQTYNPPQQANHVYNSAGPSPEIHDQRFYGNNSGYTSVPQNLH